jgi:hypothetical protein
LRTASFRRRRFLHLLACLLCLVRTVHAQRDARLRPIGGVHVGAPLGVSGFAAAVWDRGRHAWPTPDGIFLGAEAGMLGAMLSLGRIEALDGGSWIVHGGVMRSWSGDRVHVGGEARFMFWLLTFRAGAYLRVRGETGWTVMPALGIGAGF